MLGVRYRIREELGEGASAKVILVEDINESRRKKAIKRIAHNSSAEIIAIAEEEASILKILKHPNIVEYYESFKDDHYFYIVTEYCEGGTLEDFLENRNKSSIAEETVINWLRQIFSTFQYVHSKNIIHRDIKSSNILFKNGKIKICDFGVAKILEKTKTITNVGTEYYQCPEIFKRQKYDSKGDVWAIGICLYEMCTFDYPFKSPYEVWNSPTPKLVDYSKKLNELLKNLLEKDPSKRYSINDASNYMSMVFPIKGLRGLNNLGNTCFMNSVLQCLSNIPLLTEYFIEGEFNMFNIQLEHLGRKAQLANVYANLIKEMWSGNNSSISPQEFKTYLNKFAPKLTSEEIVYRDSQALLVYLLEGLHEDLNGVIKKITIEEVIDNGEPEMIAKQTWKNHVKRNNGKIVDIFHGLVKSALNCLECGEILLKFDPICYLSLPLPSKKERLIEITYVSINQNVPLTKYKLNVPKNGTISDLCNSLEQYVNVPKQRLAVCDIYNSKIFHLFELHEPVGNIRERDDIFIYELSTNYNNQDHFRISFYLRQKNQYAYKTTYFGLPSVFLMAKREFTVEKLYEKAALAIRRLIGDAEDLHFSTNDDDASQKQAKFDSQKSFFKLSLSKSDGNSYDDSSPLDENLLSQIINPSQNYLLIAECSPKLKECLQDNQFLKNVVEHESFNPKLLINKRDVLTLNDCFDSFTKKEELSDSDLWYCPKCKKHQHATKQMDLWSLPPVLIIHLKRFSYSRIYRDKIDTLVEFPIKNLDLINYIKNVNDPNKNKYKYNLIAVSNHYDGLGGGHYTTFAQNRLDGRWYNFDDSSVSSVDESSVITPAAYLLFYFREDLYAIHVNT